jgi:hypothetical protein
MISGLPISSVKTAYLAFIASNLSNKTEYLSYIFSERRAVMTLRPARIKLRFKHCQKSVAFITAFDGFREKALCGKQFRRRICLLRTGLYK